MSLIEVIADFANPGTFTVTRWLPSTALGGVVTRGASSTFPIVASVQPVTGREIVPAPAATEGEEIKVLYTETEMRGVTKAGPPDQINIPNPSGVAETWEVKAAHKWDAFEEIFYVVFVSKRGKP